VFSQGLGTDPLFHFCEFCKWNTYRSLGLTSPQIRRRRRRRRKCKILAKVSSLCWNCERGLEKLSSPKVETLKKPWAVQCTMCCSYTFFSLPTEQAETYLKICISTYHLTFICPSSFNWKKNTFTAAQKWKRLRNHERCNATPSKIFEKWKPFFEKWEIFEDFFLKSGNA